MRDNEVQERLCIKFFTHERVDISAITIIRNHHGKEKTQSREEDREAQNEAQGCKATSSLVPLGKPSVRRMANGGFSL